MILKLTEGKEFLEGYEVLKSKSLPIKISYTLARASKKVKEDVDFFTGKFQEIINEYAEKDENGNFVYTEGNQFIKVIDGKEDECQAKIAELESLETELDIEPISIDDLGDIEIDPDTLRKIMPLIKE